ncbi:MAG: MoaF N-terminal domain-containing protein [Corynebacterium sp.]|uniref:MoaF C-terminal domain-containing protein n=1 Tax=Corynebacterium sp. TaxID=1720 RepID=UPI0017C0DE9D|nr:MoaF C-terminal domain-containing protein [Corynebacterium sp.]NWO17033.1 MoaF N-terminal domain-containing protein [Corynebacterium sp.]
MTNTYNTTTSHTDAKGYVPQDQWPAVTAMLEGFGDPTLPPSKKLEETTVFIEFSDESTVECSFSNGKISWRSSTKEHSESLRALPYRAVEVRDEIFYIDFLHGEGTQTHNLTLILNRTDGKVTLADSYFQNSSGEVRVSTDFLHGTTFTGDAIYPRQESTELNGKRIYYRYSASERYEHIYLNSGTFVWHCIEGAESGLGDVDPIKVFELSEGAVLLYWSETVMPVESFVVIDLKNERSIGRMFCWDGPTLAPMHLPFDSQFTVLNQTTYPAT